MLELILPTAVESQECFGQPPGGPLFPEEQKIIAHAVATRQREYATVRSCARACLGRLGYPRVPILPGYGGAPTWPAGIRGSMTHCAGYAAAAVSHHQRIFAIGIDAEPDAPLPDGVLHLIATPAEQDHLPMTQLQPDSPNWDRLLFSAKESVYKAWFPTRRGVARPPAGRNPHQPTQPDLRSPTLPQRPHRRRPPHPPPRRPLDPQTRDPRHRRSPGPSGYLLIMRFAGRSN
jgi:hypothetical protein